MGLFKGYRTRARQKFERELGATTEVAELGAIALHPFVMTSPNQQQGVR